jgi:cleavage and polyadenylation specificity factor subunit 1
VQPGLKEPNSDLPYSPSFLVEYATIDERIRNVVDQVFLPGFNTPTIAVLFQPEQTWTGWVNSVLNQLLL